MPAGRYNFTIEQGADFSRVLTWTDSSGGAVDLTGFQAHMKIKVANASPAIVSLTITPTVNGDVLMLGGSSGTITITITHVTTAALDFREARYDLELESPAGIVTRLVEGIVSFTAEVTV